MGQTDILDGLNNEQKEAVLNTEGPLLILAGAGSGKTRVIVHRIAYLIDECGVLPSQILAITFTNKAADEMRERVDNMIGFGSREIWVMTFHSCCVRILRRHAEELGFTRYFSIYDADDQLSLMKDIFKKRNIDSKMIKEKAVLNVISNAKDEMMTPERFARENSGDFRLSKIAELYKAYQSELKANNAMDFDDLICETVRLFKERPDILELYQERFRYLMVDEYQDTNNAQFEFVRLLAGRYRNICVVGDDDQSIYKFRGANIGNILGFEKQFSNARVIKLEQNYRSTQTILDAANAVIANNEGRKAKKLWTANGKGTQIALRRFMNGFEEAEYVAGDISSKVRSGECRYKDCAILYRTNAQSRLFEEKFLMANIPYRIVGGTNFYSRKEIKDLLAYMKTVDNAVDAVAVRRIINVPKRGIGAASLTKIADYAEAGGLTFYEACCQADRINGLGKSAAKVLAFTAFIEQLRKESAAMGVSAVLKAVIKETGYVEELKAEDTEEARGRIENIDELISKAVSYEETADEPTLSGFLEEVALIADIDTVDDADDCVLLMTLHSAKGLEFDHVAIVGLEEGLFPSYMSIGGDDPTELEEERRLAYVGITRAKKTLTLTCARERLIRGDVQANPMSRFVREIPRPLVDLGYDQNQPKELNLPPDSTYSKMRQAFRTKAYGGGTYGRQASGGETYGRPAAGKTTGPGNPYDRPNPGKGSKDSRTSDFGKPAGTLDYGVGDRVKHMRFGEGTVTDIKSGGRDYEVTVDFDGTVKKMFASFARLKRV